MLRRTSLLLLGLSLLVATTAQAEGPVVKSIAANPPTVNLQGSDATFRLLIDGTTTDNRIIDLTRSAQYRSLSPKIATVDSRGVIVPLTDGKATVEVMAAGKRLEVAVVVSGTTVPRQFNFENDIIPILNKFGCNGAGCHGKAEGQNGFKLSVFGFDPDHDYQALVMQGRGRRVFPAAPERSLLLSKVDGRSPHGGGVRIAGDSAEYETLRGWIAAGMPVGSEEDPKVVSLQLTPKQRRLAMGQQQQLRAVATFSDGRQLDVTHLVEFKSNNDSLAAVDDKGFVTAGQLPGQAAVMANYMGAVDVFQLLVPRAEQIDFASPDQFNFIDGLVYRQLRQLNIAPSGVTDDATFLRRAHLDIIGTLPTAEETRHFLADKNPNRRAQLVDQLLKRPEYADYWALMWSDLLRVDRQKLGRQAAYDYYRWIHNSFATNKPMDRFASEILTAEGPLSESPQGNLFKVVTNPGTTASTVSQVFLGIRIECAQCHHHPFDRWSQTDYFGMQSFFAQVRRKKTPWGEALTAKGNPITRHPRSRQPVFAHPLGTQQPEQNPEGDRRRVLADWMTAPDNPYFARSMVNRVWARMTGRGLVEPIDDFRQTNPPSNPELLDALAKHFVQSGYNLQTLIRTIAASRVYQHSSTPNATNAKDEQNYSRALWKRLDAEVLLDAVCQTTGVKENFRQVESGKRAIALWDSQVDHYFLKLFGRPSRKTACECERNAEPSVAQVLHFLNSERINSKLSHESGTVARLTRQTDDNSQLVEELYLSIFNRYPDEKERTVAVGYLDKSAGNRRVATEDLVWSMLNSMEFLFIR